MADKYNTSSNYTAGENTELGETVKLCQINYTLYFFLFEYRYFKCWTAWNWL